MSRVLYPALPILLVDDEPQILLSFSAGLQAAGINHVLTVEDGREVCALLTKHDAAVIVLDLALPHLSGADLLAQINRDFPHIPVVIVTATYNLETAVECMRGGAFDYLVKPVEINRFLSSIKKALELSELKTEVSLLKQHLLADHRELSPAFAPIVTVSGKMRAVFQYVGAIATSQNPALISGETGVGKELIAKSIHDLSGRKGAFIAVNIAGLDDVMFSDALFGHKKGAYTGADLSREGLIAQASGGTLFLDEIGDLSEASQVKLLRLLQDRKYLPLGSDLQRQSDARIVTATNQDIRDLIRRGSFRKDLYYRLCAHQIHIPPLRDRIEDIPLLLNHFLEAAAKSLDKKKPSYPPELVTLLSTYDFPGNVREFQTMVYDAVARHKRGILSLHSFKEAIGLEQASTGVEMSSSLREPGTLQCTFSRFPTLKEAENHLIKEALKLSGYNQGTAASLLGITRQALNKRLARERGDTASGPPRT